MAARDIQFVIKARDEASRAFDTIAAALAEMLGAATGAGKANADISRIIQTLGQFGAVSKQIFTASDQATNAFQQQSAKVEQLAGKLANLKQQAANAASALSQIKGAAAATGGTADAGQVKAVEQAQKDLQRQVQRTSRDLETERTTLQTLRNEAQKLGSLANATEAAGPQVDNAQLLAQQTAAAETIRNMLNPALAIQRRYEEQIAAVKKNKLLTTQEQVAAEKLLAAEMKRELASAGRGEGGRPTLFGLKPYELTNLGYQVNDIVSGLASGQNIMQIIAQQGGQVLQLMPRLGASIISALTNPAILAAALAFGAIAFAIKQAADQAQRLRELAGILRANADGARYSATQLEANVEQMKQFGLTAAQASDIVKTFIKEGIDPDRLVVFGQAAKDLSRVLGIDVKDAAKQVADAATGGYDAIVKLDDATNFLTTTEREHIRTLFESGHAEEARADAMDKLQRKMHAGAEAMRSDFSKAVERLDQAWEHLKDSLADSEWANVVLKTLNALATVLEHVADEMQATADATERLNAPKGGGEAGGASAGGGGGGGWGGETNANGKAASDALHNLELQRQTILATGDAERVRLAGQEAVNNALKESNDLVDTQLQKIRQSAEETERLRIQQERRNDLLKTAEGFLGRSENNRQDVAVLQSLFQQYGVQMPKGVPLDQEKAAWCAAFVNAILGSKGLPGTGSLSAKSFLNYGTPVSVREAQPGDIVILKGAGSHGHVGFFEGRTANGNLRILGGNQSQTGSTGAVTVSNFKPSSVLGVRRVGAIGEATQGLDTAAQKAQELAVAQSDFNHALEIEAAERALVIKYMREQLGMSAQQLYDSKKKEEIDQAILHKEQEAHDKNIEFTDAQKTALREQLGAQYDVEHAEQLINDKLREQQDLRDTILKGIEDAINRGDTDTVNRLTDELNKSKPAFEAALDEAIKFFSQFNSPEAQAALDYFKQLKRDIDDSAAAIANAKAQHAEQVASGASDLQSSLQSAVGTAQRSGDVAGARALEQAYMAATIQLILLKETAIKANEELLKLSDAELASQGKTREGVEATIVKLKEEQQAAANSGREFLMTGKQINEMIADDLTSGFENFITMVSQGRNVFQSLGIAFAQTAADILKSLGEMILKQALFNMLSGGGSGNGGVGGSIAGAAAALFPAAIMLNTSGGTLTAAGGLLTGAGGTLISAGALWQATAAELMAAAQMLIIANTASFAAAHTGGIAGFPTMRRSVSPLVFAGAMRYHVGGLAGLRPGEVPTILKRGEEVLTEDNPRHIKNQRGGRGAGGGMGGPGLKQVLLFDPADIAAAMRSSEGRKVFLTHIRGARREINTILSGNG